jgi:hypothetical protein
MENSLLSRYNAVKFDARSRLSRASYLRCGRWTLAVLQGVSPVIIVELSSMTAEGFAWPIDPGIKVEFISIHCRGAWWLLADTRKLDPTFVCLSEI